MLDSSLTRPQSQLQRKPSPLSDTVGHYAQQQQQQQQQQQHSNGLTEMDRLWNLLADLSNQLSQNRQQTEDLHRAAILLKAQAIHTQTGFTLRRFNLDISQEEFESEVERMNVTLVLENQSLQHENRQISTLLKDYEGTLEAVMGKFRSHAYSTQQHHLDLIRHYESILLSLPSASLTTSSPPRSPSQLDSPTIDPLHLSLSLAHLASLVRKALRSLQGENPDEEESVGSPSLSMTSRNGEDDMEGNEVLDDEFGDLKEQLDGVLTNSSALLDRTPCEMIFQARNGSSRKRTKPTRDVSEGGYIGSSASTSPHHVPTLSTLLPSPVPTPLALSAISDPVVAISDPLSTATPLTSSAVASPPPVVLPPSPAITSTVSMSAGEDLLFSRRRVPIDDALEREIEVEMLRKENESLRALLGISTVGGQRD